MITQMRSAAKMETAEYVTCTILMATLMVAIYVYVHLQNRKYPPGPYGVPLLGYLPFFKTTIAKTVFKMRNKYGDVVSISIGSRTIVFLNNWEAIKEAFVRQGDVFSGRPILKSHIKGKKGIVFVDGPPWKAQRRVATNLLRQVGLAVPTFQDVIIVEVEKLTEFLKAQEGEPVDIVEIFTLYLINTTLMILAGEHFDRAEEDRRFLKNYIDSRNGHEILPIVLYNSIIKNLICTKSDNEQSIKLFAYAKRVIESHQKTSKSNIGNNFIDLYLAEIERNRKADGTEKEPYTVSDLICTCHTLLSAGIETASATLQWAILCITYHEEVQRRIHEELDGLISMESILTQDSKALAPYTQAVILEVQRFAVITMLTVPHRAMKDAVVFGHNIPKDTMVFGNLYATCNDERYWKDPDVFRPERFLDEQGQLKQYEHLIPFSAGPRLCLGESLAKREVFLMFANLLRRFAFSFVPDEPVPRMDSDLDSLTRKLLPFSLIVKYRR